MLRGALDEKAECFSDRSSGGSTLEAGVERFAHYEVVKDEDGRPVELGRGAMGVTYKALDVDLRCRGASIGRIASGGYFRGA